MPKMKYWNGTAWVELDAKNADNASKLNNKSDTAFVQSINGIAASSGAVTLAASDVGAAASDHTHTPASIGAAPASHTHTAADLPSASTSAAGVVQLSSSTSSTSATTAATSAAVKSAYDLANGKLGAGATAVNAEKVNGHKVTVATTAPASPTANDIWIDTN